MPVLSPQFHFFEAFLFTQLSIWHLNLSAVDAEHTRMDWTAQVAVSGTIASVGARLLHQTAEKLTGQFFDCLKTKLQTAETVSAGE